MWPAYLLLGVCLAPLPTGGFSTCPATTTVTRVVMKTTQGGVEPWIYDEPLAGLSSSTHEQVNVAYDNTNTADSITGETGPDTKADERKAWVTNVRAEGREADTAVPHVVEIEQMETACYTTVIVTVSEVRRTATSALRLSHTEGHDNPSVEDLHLLRGLARDKSEITNHTASQSPSKTSHTASSGTGKSNAGTPSKSSKASKPTSSGARSACRRFTPSQMSALMNGDQGEDGPPPCQNKTQKLVRRVVSSCKAASGGKSTTCVSSTMTRTTSVCVPLSRAAGKKSSAVMTNHASASLIRPSSSRYARKSVTEDFEDVVIRPRVLAEPTSTVETAA